MLKYMKKIEPHADIVRKKRRTVKAFSDDCG